MVIAARVLRRSLSSALASLRHKSSTSSPSAPGRRYPPPPSHEFSKPCEFLGSWTLAHEPREAKARLGRLRRDYARQVKELRQEYAYEMELLRLEKQRKDDARREAARLANEERKVAKAVAAETRAAERKAFEEEFRQQLLKERVEKLESWRAKENLREQKKTKEKELLRQQSSIWISEENLQNRIMEATVDTTPL